MKRRVPMRDFIFLIVIIIFITSCAPIQIATKDETSELISKPPKYTEVDEEETIPKIENFIISEREFKENIPEFEGNLSITFHKLIESRIAVNGPWGGESYIDSKGGLSVKNGEFYTFHALEGMKFVIIIFEYVNNGLRAVTTPYLESEPGILKIAVETSYFYDSWKPSGMYDKKYMPRESTEIEIKRLIGKSGAYEKLLPEESTLGCWVFEIPKETTPVKLSIRRNDRLRIVNLQKERYEKAETLADCYKKKTSY